MAYFCTRTGARLIGPGTVDTVAVHDGSAAADEAEHQAGRYIAAHFTKLMVGSEADRPAPDAPLMAEASKVAAGVYAEQRKKAEAAEVARRAEEQKKLEADKKAEAAKREGEKAPKTDK